MAEGRYSIQELVTVSGVPRRTIRYYVQRGLLPAPEGAGRGHYYTEAHLERLRHVRSLQQEGRTLDEIAERVDRPRAMAPAPAADPVPLSLRTHLEVSPGVEVSFTDPARVPSPARLRALITAMQRILGSEGGSHD